MKRTRIPVVILFALALTVPVLHADSWTGWITDEGCGAKGANAEHKECALRCAKHGKAFVLFNSADKKIYKLDNQESAKEQVGHKVKVTGTLDGETIKVEKIEQDAAE